MFSMSTSDNKKRTDRKDSVRSYGILLLAIVSFLLICEMLIFALRVALG